MESVAIVGVGLIGGSFGLALRAAGFGGPILGVSSPGAISDAIACGAIDAGCDLETAANTCDLIYLAQPISRIEETIEKLGPVAPENCLITDAGSTKSKIVKTATEFVKSAQFLGGHPMAGKEKRGVTHASADLFDGRPYVLTPSEPSELNTPLVGGFIDWLRRCGADIITVSAERHDRTVAFTSHLPQMSSTALSVCVGEAFRQDENYLRIAGPGLADMSRLALSSYEIWKDIIETNAENIQHALDVYIDKLTELRDNLHTRSLGNVFANATEIATGIRRQNNKKS